MKKDLMKLAAVGLAAGLCLSSSNVSSMEGEIAMAKCSKDMNDTDMKSNDNMDNNNKPNNDSKCGSCGGKSGCNSTPAPKKNKNQSTQVQRRSAAQKVVQGG